MKRTMCCVTRKSDRSMTECGVVRQPSMHAFLLHFVLDGWSRSQRSLHAVRLVLCSSHPTCIAAAAVAPAIYSSRCYRQRLCRHQHRCHTCQERATYHFQRGQPCACCSTERTQQRRQGNLAVAEAAVAACQTCLTCSAARGGGVHHRSGAGMTWCTASGSPWRSCSTAAAGASAATRTTLLKTGPTAQHSPQAAATGRHAAPSVFLLDRPFVILHYLCPAWS